MRVLTQALQSISGLSLQRSVSEATTSLASWLTAGRDCPVGKDAMYSGVTPLSAVAGGGTAFSDWQAVSRTHNSSARFISTIVTAGLRTPLYSLKYPMRI